MSSMQEGPRNVKDKELSILRSAVENTNEAFVTIDEKHEVVLFNRAAEKVFGYSREEVIGRDLGIIMAPGCSQDHRNAVEKYVKTRHARRIGHDTELIAARKGGKTFPANISFSVSEVDEKLYFTAIVTDLTEKKELQKKIAESERLAALGQFVAEITHEIRNPLMMIGGFANQLLRQSSDDKIISKLNVISGEVLRLERLLSELKDFYQPGVMKYEKIDVAGLLTEIITFIRHDCIKKDINVEFSENESPIIIKADRDKLKQVILNLIKNAIEAMDKGGSIQVKSREENGYVEISIEDDGCGIAACDRERVFSPFFTTKKNGTGLGLSISKGIIEAHEGSSFTLTSEEGKGSTFKIIMPIVNLAAEQKKE
jgi:two-component system, LuxR family, sensor kinase FixL